MLGPRLAPRAFGRGPALFPASPIQCRRRWWRPGVTSCRRCNRWQASGWRSTPSGWTLRWIQLELDPRGVPQVPNDGVKVAWYEFTAKPGTGGNAVLSGHVRWAGDPGVFHDLDELEDGDVIRIRWTDGEELVYEVSANLLLDADDAKLLEAMGPTEEDTITLITCGGTWETDLDNPLGGDFTKRVVVEARLEEPSAAAISP